MNENINKDTGEDERDWDALDAEFNEYLDTTEPPVLICKRPYPPSAVLDAVDPRRWGELFRKWLDQREETHHEHD